MRTHEPEREMVRRALPVGAGATLVAIVIAWITAGTDAAFSAAIGGAVVLVNTAVNGYSLAWGAKGSPNVLAAVAGIGFFVRMAIIFGVMAILMRTAFFSPVAFILAAVPVTVLMLAFEAKIVMGPMGREIRIPGEQPST